LLQHGIDKKFKDFCDEGDTCLMFQKSQFIVIINKKDLKIITVRDTQWDKPIGNKPCKRTMIFESDEQILDVIENVNFNNVDFNGYSYYMTGDTLMLEVEYTCKCCIQINL
jgi:hypothetical protein